MVMDTLDVSPEGASLPPSEWPPDMVMDMLEVAPEDGTTGPVAPPEPDAETAEKPPPVAETEPYQVQAFERGTLRIAIFTSNSDRPKPAYDGVLIETSVR
jgi:hypothetical protein